MHEISPMRETQKPANTVADHRKLTLFRFCAISIAILFIWIIGALSFINLRDFLALSKWLDHAQLISYEAEHLQSLMKNIEICRLADEEHPLSIDASQCASSPEQIHSTISRLQTLTSYDASQKRHLETLLPLVSAYLDSSLAEINRKNTPPRSYLSSSSQSYRVETIWDVADQIIAEEENLYKSRSQSTEKRVLYSMWALVIGALASTFIIAVLFFYMNRESKSRKTAQSNERETSKELESLIEKRKRDAERNRLFLSALLSITRDAIFVHRDGKIVYVNNACLDLLKANAAEQVIGHSPYEFFHEDEHEKIRQRISNMMEKGTISPTIEEKVKCMDGSLVTAEVSSAPFFDGKGPVILVILRDITDKKQTQQQLHQAQKMEAVGQLTGGLAHDFNNLLTIIIGNLDLLEATDSLDNMAKKQIHAALEAALRGAELNKHLLAFSRQQPLVTQVIDLNTVVLGTVSLLERTLGERVVVITKLQDNLWQAEADPSQVESAIANLAINSRDAMPNGGRLFIETKNAHLDAEYAAQNHDVIPGDYVTISVSDTGEGIPPEIIDRVFEPFFTTKSNGKGTGLGLSMVYGFAKQSKGHVKIYSELGHGTTIRLYLPRAKSCPVFTESQDDSALSQTALDATILVVEDNTSVRKVVIQQLSDLGYKILEAQDATAALNILDAGHPVDLLFTDIMMPGDFSGIELAERAKKLRPTLKILFTSGFTEAGFQNQSPSFATAQLLSKPYRKEELARRIREMLLQS